ncbi:MAG: replicative DNA helicase [Gemmatimonadetes bacterium]|nr:replicative DNA helicase [Gemmatimonadota bacterium]
MNGREAGVATLPVTDRPPPYAAEAEISVLGGMLVDRDAAAKVLESVDDSMFYREANRRLFRAMVRLFERGQVIDPVTITEELKKTQELESVGGMAYVAELLDAVPTAANIEYHARIVREKALLRRLIEASTQIVRSAQEPGERTVEQVLDEAEQRIFQVAQTHEREGFVWIKQILFPAMGRIEELQAAKGGLTGVASGFHDLDEMTGGFQKGDLIILASRPSMGKTALMLGMGLHAAIRHRLPVALFSLEMSDEQLVERMLCHEALIDLRNVRRGRLNEDDYLRLSDAAAHLNTAPMWIDDSALLTVLEMRAKARRLKADRPDLGLLLVDYIQLMQGHTRFENRTQEVSQISRGLKALAKELEIPIIALSQLSRAPEQRADRRPQLSDLRESGSLEQDADVVMLLYRQDYYLSNEEAVEKDVANKAELIVAKQRNGPTGLVKLTFQKASTRFYLDADAGR